VADILASSQSGRTAAAAKEDTTHVTTPNAEKNSHAHRTTIPIKIPTGPSIRGLDIGTGASLIYPLLGTQTYGWSFLATDVDPTSMASARSICAANHDVLSVNIDIRLQRNKQTILKHVLTADDERIDFCMCNPPFYESAAAYQKENARKVRNLAANARKRQSQSQPQAQPRTFIAKMMEESSCLAIDMPSKCLWFSSLVSRRDNLPKLMEILESNVVRRNKQVKDVRIIQMGQGGLKTSQILFWSFHDREEQRAWFRE
jgi:23S rRNA (adenine1618-N6)-methyltransferase